MAFVFVFLCTINQTGGHMEIGPRYRKIAVQQLHSATDVKFAVFMRSESGGSAKFAYLHDSLESAIETCRKYAAKAVGHGHSDFTYYAVEIKHRVGIEHGKIVDEATR
jgi:hypothetical protein